MLGLFFQCPQNHHAKLQNVVVSEQLTESSQKLKSRLPMTAMAMILVAFWTESRHPSEGELLRFLARDRLVITFVDYR